MKFVTLEKYPEKNNLKIYIEESNKRLLLNGKENLTTKEKLIYFSETKTGFLILSLITFFIYPAYYYFFYFEHQTFSDEFFNKQKQIDFLKEIKQEKINEKTKSFNKKILLSFEKINFWKLIKKKISQTIILSSVSLYSIIFRFFKLIKENLYLEENKLWSEKNKNLEYEKEHNNEIKKLEKKLEKKLKIEENNKQNVDFDIEKKLRKSLKNNSKKKWKISIKKYDIFIFFIFVISYFLVSIFTLGIFPMYHIKKGIFRKNQFDLLNTKKQSDYISIEDFNEKINKLTNNVKDDFDYSSKLISSVTQDLKIQNSQILFKTKIFRNDLTKFLAIFLLMVSTFSFFGIYLISKNTYFNKTNINLPLKNKDNDDFETIGNYYSWLKKMKWKWKSIYDFGFDLKIVANLIANRKTNSSRSLKIFPSKKEDYFIFFLKTITSSIFKWLFTIFLLIASVTVACIWIIIANAAITSFWLILLIFLLFFLFVGLSYHIFLLF